MMEILASVPSTMDAARDNIWAGRVVFDAQGRAHPAGIMAREQTAGRGQRGRVWHARPGECLCATYYFQHGLAAPEQAGQIAFVAGVAAAETLQKIVGSISGNHSERPVRVGLKWPNDVLLNGRKVGGILIELTQTSPAGISASGEAQSSPFVALVGVGINVDVVDFPPELEAIATSLRREGIVYGGGMDWNWRWLSERLGKELTRWGQTWREGGLPTILPHWRAYDQTPGRYFETVLGGARVEGVATGLADDGALCLRLADNRLVAVHTASSLQERPDLSPYNSNNDGV